MIEHNRQVRGHELGHHAGLARWWAEVDDYRRRHTRSGALVYTWNVNYRIGAWLARAVQHRRVTPNQLSLLGMAASVAGAVAAAIGGWDRLEDVSPVQAVLVTVAWQLAYSLDCADGLLARARGTANPFGAWLDQCADFVSHVAVSTALVVVVARSIGASSPAMALTAGLVVGANLFMLFATSQYNSLLGPASTAGNGGSTPSLLTRRPLRVAMGARHLTDYGAFLLLAGLLLPYPRALLAVLVIGAVAQIGATVGQVALNWPGLLSSRTDLPATPGAGPLGPGSPAVGRSAGPLGPGSPAVGRSAGPLGPGESDAGPTRKEVAQ
jgi:phosphatidylglycerophosphate synthase